MKVKISLGDTELNQKDNSSNYFFVSTKYENGLITIKDIDEIYQTLISGKGLESFTISTDVIYSEEIVIIPDISRLTERFFWKSKYKLFVLLDNTVEPKDLTLFLSQSEKEDKAKLKKYFLLFDNLDLSLLNEKSFIEIGNMLLVLLSLLSNIPPGLNYFKLKHFSQELLNKFKKVYIKNVDRNDLKKREETLIALLRININHYLNNADLDTGEKIVINKIFRIDDRNSTIFIAGDIHADSNTLFAFLESQDIIFKLITDEKIKVIFLGDYIDRGEDNLGVLTTLLFLQAFFWGKVFLIRGNHEQSLRYEKNELGDDFPIGYEEPEEISENIFSSYFIKKYKEYFSKEFFNLWDKFINEMAIWGVLEENKVVLFHGGIPPFLSVEPNKIEDIFPYLTYINDLGDFREINIDNLKWNYVEENILWGRPVQADWVNLRPHTSYTFGQKQLLKFLDKFSFKMAIRGHDAHEKGFEISSEGKCITLHTTGGIGNNNSFYSNSVKSPAFVRIENNEINIFRMFLEGSKISFLLKLNLINN